MGMEEQMLLGTPRRVDLISRLILVALSLGTWFLGRLLLVLSRTHRKNMDCINFWFHLVKELAKHRIDNDNPMPMKDALWEDLNCFVLKMADIKPFIR